MSKWNLVSKAWGLNELALIAEDAVIAVRLLRLRKVKKLPINIDEKQLKDKIVNAKKILDLVLDEIDMIRRGTYEPTNLVKGLQVEYGYKDLNKVREKVIEVKRALEDIEKGKYNEKTFNAIERLLDCIANKAASEFHELMVRIRGF